MTQFLWRGAMLHAYHQKLPVAVRRVRHTMKKRLLEAAILLVALVPSMHLAWLARDLPQLGLYDDDGLYWVTAKSLADGDTYRILSLPGQPFETKYPPLYPWVLSWAWRVNPTFSANVPLAALLAWVMLCLYILSARLLYACLGLTAFTQPSSARSWP